MISILIKLASLTTIACNTKTTTPSAVILWKRSHVTYVISVQGGRVCICSLQCRNWTPLVNKSEGAFNSIDFFPNKERPKETLGKSFYWHGCLNSECQYLNIFQTILLAWAECFEKSGKVTSRIRLIKSLARLIIFLARLIPSVET